MGRKTKRPRAEGEAPKKCDFRQRAHSNPLADVGEDGHPPHPSWVDWHASFPQHFAPLEPGGPAAAEAAPARAVEWVDVGCGYGGLLMSLATEFPDKLMLGMEIRHKVAEFAHEKIVSLRREHEGSYQNVDVIQTNTMKYVPQFFFKGQLEKMMFCFPDPHFKKNTHRRRIISADMNAEYAYCLREGGLAYVVTDVLELYEWMVRYLEEHPLFDRLTAEEEAADPVVPFIRTRTDESIKVERNQGQKYSAVYRRRADAGGWGLVAAECHASGAARILAEARLSGNWIATADGCPDIVSRAKAYAVQQAMCTLGAGSDSVSSQHTERGKALAKNLGEQCGWKLLTEWSLDGLAKASSVGAAVNGETHAAMAAKEKLQAAAEAAAIKGGKGQQIRAPLFTSALREAEAGHPRKELLVLPKVTLNAQCVEANLGVFLGAPLVRGSGSAKDGAYTAAEVWHAVSQVVPVLEVLGSRLLTSGLTNWERAADGGGNVVVCLGKRVPLAQLAGHRSLDFAMTRNKQPAATAVHADMSRLQAQLATLVNEVLLGASPAEAGLHAGCLLLTSIPGTQLSAFAPGDLVAASFGEVLGDVTIQWDAADTADSAAPLRRGAYDKAFLKPMGKHGYITTK